MDKVTTVPLWVPFATAGLGVLFGFVASIVKDIWQERRRIKNCWNALRAEFEICTAFARSFIDSRIMAPSYRLPTTAYERVFPEILTGAGLTSAQAYDLVHYFTNVEALNRGLDHAQDAANRNDGPTLQRQSQTNFNRAERHLVEGTAEHAAALRVLTQYSTRR